MLKGTRRAGRRLPWGLVGMLVLVGSIEVGIRRNPIAFTTIWAQAWSEARRAADHEARDASLLFFGDSQVMQGVAPQVVRHVSGMGAYNLALFQGLAPTSYFLLKRALDAGARPAAVLIDGELLGEDPGAIGRLWAELLSYRELIDLARTSRDPRLLASVAIARILPSMKARFEIRTAVVSALAETAANQRRGLVWNLRKWRRNFGAAIPSADFLSASDAADALNRQAYFPSAWTCHPTNAAYVERFLALAKSREIPVFWLLPPIHPEVQQRRDRGGLSAGYERYLVDLAARHPGLVILDARHSEFPAQACADFTHLNRVGAAAFSERIGAVVRDSIAAGDVVERWTKLPAYSRPAPEWLAAFRIEDYEDDWMARRPIDAIETIRR